MTVVTFALILLGAVAVVLAVALLQRAREVRRLRELGERVQAVADSGDLAERLTPHAGAGQRRRDRWRCRPADRATAAVRARRAKSARGIYRRLLETMHEAMLVERDGIELANARFAELWASRTRQARRPQAVRPGACRIRRTGHEYLRRPSAGEPRRSDSKSTCSPMAPASRTVSNSASRVRCSTVAPRSS